MRNIDLQQPVGLEAHCLIRLVQSHLIAVFISFDGTVASATVPYKELFGTDDTFDTITHPDDLYDDELRQQLLAGKIDKFRTEKRLIDRNGEEHWYEVEVMRLQPPTEATDSMLAIVLEEITEQRKIYDALLWNERRWRNLVRQSWLLFLQCDGTGKLLYATPMLLNLLDLGDNWINSPIASLIHPEDLGEFDAFFTKSLHGDSSSIICRFKAQAGAWLEFKLRPQIDQTETLILHAQDLSTQFFLQGQLQFYRSRYKALLSDLSQMFSI